MSNYYGFARRQSLFFVFFAAARSGENAFLPKKGKKSAY
jgi:hypothetical protein